MITRDFFRSVITVVLLAFAVFAPAAAAFPCFEVSYEYCMVGCENLGPWVVEPYHSLTDASARVEELSADWPSRASAFAVQLPIAMAPAAVIRRSSPAFPGPASADPALPGLHWQVYQGEHAALDAAADVEVFGGFLYSGNDGGSLIRVWWRSCNDVAPSRLRPARPVGNSSGLSIADSDVASAQLPEPGYGPCPDGDPAHLCEQGEGGGDVVIDAGGGWIELDGNTIGTHFKWQGRTVSYTGQRYFVTHALPGWCRVYEAGDIRFETNADHCSLDDLRNLVEDIEAIQKAWVEPGPEE
jgi:hypothetical protein